LYSYDKGPENGIGGEAGINPLTTHVFVHVSNMPANSFAKPPGGCGPENNCINWGV
jgi:hypothetical protein